MPGFTPISSVPDPSVSERLSHGERKPAQPSDSPRQTRIEGEDDDSKAPPVSSDGHSGPGGRGGRGRLDRVG
jgi:hypothetical protein